MGSYDYICFFNFGGVTRFVMSDRGIQYFSEGFWVGARFEITGIMANDKYWIPPSQIQYIERLPKQ